MTKYCSLITAEKQLCYNHAIHLSVVKVMYNSINNFEVEKSDDKNKNSPEDEIDEQGESENVIFFVENSEKNGFISDIKPVIYEMRKLIKFFKNSSIRTEVLL